MVSAIPSFAPRRGPTSRAGNSCGGGGGQTPLLLSWFASRGRFLRVRSVMTSIWSHSH